MSWVAAANVRFPLWPGAAVIFYPSTAFQGGGGGICVGSAFQAMEPYVRFVGFIHV